LRAVLPIDQWHAFPSVSRHVESTCRRAYAVPVVSLGCVIFWRKRAGRAEKDRSLAGTSPLTTLIKEEGLDSRSPSGGTSSVAVDRAGNIGPGASISGTVHQEFHVDSGGGGKGKWYLGKDVLIPLGIALAAATTGAYLKHKFDLYDAPEKTIVGTQTLLGLSQNLVAQATQERASPGLIANLKQLDEQARAVEAASALLDNGGKKYSQKVDFWLRPGAGGIRLGGTTSLGIHRADPDGNNLVINVDNVPRNLLAGGYVGFKKDGQQCAATLVAKSPDALYGFNVDCQKATK
jgi:hypothetical protein